MKKLIRITEGEIDFAGNPSMPFASLEQMLMIIAEQYDSKGLASFIRIKGLDEEGKQYSVGLDFSNYQMRDQEKGNTVSIERVGKQKFMGEMLVEGGVINEGQLAAALKAQAESSPKQKLGEVLIKMGLCKPEQIITAIAQQIGAFESA